MIDAQRHNDTKDSCEESTTIKNVIDANYGQNTSVTNIIKTPITRDGMRPQLRRLENSAIEIRNTASIILIFNFLN